MFLHLSGCVTEEWRHAVGLCLDEQLFMLSMITYFYCISLNIDRPKETIANKNLQTLVTSVLDFMLK